jgi:hypothetical protein
MCQVGSGDLERGQTHGGRRDMKKIYILQGKEEVRQKMESGLRENIPSRSAGRSTPLERRRRRSDDRP